MKVKKIITLLICLCFPSRALPFLLRILGYKVGEKIKIGFSIIWLDSIELKDNVKIGHFNLVNVASLNMSKYSYLQNFNILSGPINVLLDEKASFGNFNIVRRAPIGITYGKAEIKLGQLARITSSHYIDCTRNVEVGDFSILAGKNSQIWTHGYYHDQKGPGRYRIDGDVKIGSNVYVGSRCIFNLGVKVVDGVTIGSGAIVSKSLNKKGLYVSQRLRHIETNADMAKASLFKIDKEGLCEEVYEKRIS
ncbi:hypothetical protein AAG747_29010 [Rapidithrix thailandica]|uniref:Uncharacterized protein n=1 Tax=Rapidithrix thailandica TaxID=413964 RepID=A0AAW9SJM9_9BACT